MKKIFCILGLTIILYSCKQTVLEYSCDPELNKFVIENKAELSRISVTELSSYNLTLQKAIFRSWNAEQKRNAWISKLNKVLSSITFSEAEVNHIKKLIHQIDINYFSEANILINKMNHVNFANEWLNYARKELGWSEEFIAFLVYRLYTNQSQFSVELKALRAINAETSTNSETGTCNCNTAVDFCSDSACKSSGCTTKNGCGWLWSDSCNGLC